MLLQSLLAVVSTRIGSNFVKRIVLKENVLLCLLQCDVSNRDFMRKVSSELAKRSLGRDGDAVNSNYYDVSPVSVIVMATAGFRSPELEYGVHASWLIPQLPDKIQSLVHGNTLTDIAVCSPYGGP